MRKILAISLLFMSFFTLKGQQDPLYSQYMFNGLVLNPAYAGSREQASLTLIGRMQWVGLTGSPFTQSFGAHVPSRNLRHGFGVMVINDAIGFTNSLNINMAYAYRIPIKSVWLSMGIQGGLNHYHANLDEVGVRDPGDPAFQGQKLNIFSPNAGAGIYINHERFYIGFSVPNLITSRLHPRGIDELQSRRYVHYLATAGVVIPLGNNLKFKPSVLLKYVKNSPFSVDVNGSLLIKNIFWIGASWRIKDAVDFIAEFQITRQLRVGYSFDYTLTQLRGYTKGTHEIMLGFDFGFRKFKMASPRYF